MKPLRENDFTYSPAFAIPYAKRMRQFFEFLAM